MSNRRWSLSAESITAAAAVVAALIALAVGVWENAQERRHNRLSVFPHLDFIAELRQRDDPGVADSAVIRVANEGVGPAIIDGLRIELRDPSGRGRVYADWESAEETLESWGILVRNRARLGEGSVLGIGREYTLATLEAVEAEDETGVHPFDRLLERLGIVITYRSIYGDEYRTTLGEVD